MLGCWMQEDSEREDESPGGYFVSRAHMLNQDSPAAAPGEREPPACGGDDE